MFTQGLRGRGMAGLGEFVNQPRKVETWLPNTFGAQASIIPGLAPSTATAVAAGGGIVAALAAAWAAWKFLK